MSDKNHHGHHQSSYNHSGGSLAGKESRKRKKKFTLFYKINFFTVLFISLILLYFVILVSAKPKSFPYITQKIKEHLSQNFSDDVVIENSYISFTAHGSFKIMAINVKINKSKTVDDKNNNKTEFEIPKIEAEFPIYNFLLFRFTPSKIKITDPSIIFYKSQDYLETKGIANEINSVENKSLIYVAPLLSFFDAIKNDKLHVKIFEIENFKLLLRDNIKSDTEFLLKKSFVKVESKNRNSKEVLQISSSNIVSLNKNKDINISANCKFNPNNNTLCNLVLLNLAVDSLSDLNPALKPLEQFKIIVNASAALKIENNKVHSLNFQAEAKKGSFDLPEFFSKKINFSNLSLKGNYDNEADNLNISSIEANLERPENNDSANNFFMSLFVNNLQNTQNKKMDFLIKIKNTPTSEIEGLWPISLPEPEIRNWVVTQINNGVIEDAFAKFSLITQNGVTDLEDIKSQITFDNLNLTYDEYFPQITKLKGVATFNKNNMEINISSANVLESKISNARVSIDDFESDITMLNIEGELIGNASDGLKHADYKSSFAIFAQKYLNGTSTANFIVRVPLLDEIFLKDVYIFAKEKANNINNEYFAGNVEIETLKDFNSDNFLTKIDVTNASISAKFFNIEKRSGSVGSLNFSLLVGDKDILFKNLILTKKEEITENKKRQTVNAKLSGNINIDINSGSLISINLSNHNFGKNDYLFSYDNNSKFQKISVSGKLIDLTSFLKNKSPVAESSEALKNLIIKVSLAKVILINNKSLKNFSASINYNDGLFYNSFVKANFLKQQTPIIDLTATTKPKDNFSTINGLVSDVGYLAEGLYLSDTILGGSAKIKIISQKINGINNFTGEVKINNDITFYENNATKRLAKNDLFSTVKDSIFSNNKTTFDFLKLNFVFVKNNFEISSFVANNYKIGITAKGFVDFANKSYSIKGMIIPGFVVNNLFGIGKIPLIGGVISNVLTGGEGGGLFGIKYEYKKLPDQKEATFETNKVSAFVPVSIRSLFE